MAHRDSAHPDAPRGDATVESQIEGWLGRLKAENPLVLAVDRDPDLTRWYVRMRGDEKSFTTVWLTLRETTLWYETQFMPAPEENLAQCYEYLLRVNQRLFGLRFSIGDEDAVYLTGQMPIGSIDDDELDRIIGASYAYSEECFPTAMQIGYASKYRRRPPASDPSR